jgi:hypothetical protein
MRLFNLLLLLVPTILFGQCDPPSLVSFLDFGTQQTDVDYYDDADFLDELNNSTLWNIGTGISDNNLTLWSNGDIETFLGVKLRNAIAPNDNVPSLGNVYQAASGFSPNSMNSTQADGPQAKWNILMYVDLETGSFADVGVKLWLDFDPCFAPDTANMVAIDVSPSLQDSLGGDYTSFGINTNLGYPLISNLNPAGNGFDANATGYYTFAIEISDLCGNQKLWNDITVYVQPNILDGVDLTSDSDSNGVYDVNEFAGCMSQQACNFSCSATTDDGSCESISCSGCTVESACNYNPEAEIGNAEDCTFPMDVYGVDYVNCSNVCLSDVDGDGVCDQAEVPGCQNTEACNFNADATDPADCSFSEENYNCAGDCLNDTDNDGVCDELEIAGCTESFACNYNSNATNDDASCETTSCAGCGIVPACNYDPQATISNNDICKGPGGDCDDEDDGTINDVYTSDCDCVGQLVVLGCTEPSACNFSILANEDDESCLFNADALGVCGGSCTSDADGDGICDDIDNCWNQLTCNFNDPQNGVCESITCAGCKLDGACNYDSEATIADNDSCLGEAASCDDGDPNTTNDVFNDNCGCFGEPIVEGCTDSTNPWNYDENANVDDGSCVNVLSGSGCNYCAQTNPDGSCADSSPVCNYGPYAISNNEECSTSCVTGEGSDSPIPLGFITVCNLPWACNYNLEGDCEYTSCVGCMDPNGCDYNASSTQTSTCDYSCLGCTNSLADNYDSSSTTDDGSCLVPGCMNSIACNYEITATYSDNSCDFSSCVGCMDTASCSYDASATMSQSSNCTYATNCDTCSGETDGSGTVVDNDTDDDGVCNADEVLGCDDSSACNYNSAATDNDGSCQVVDACGTCGGSGVDTDGDGVCDANEVSGCTNSIACNYDSAATENAGCEYSSCVGCMDSNACNFDPNATLNQLLDCVYVISGYDCAGGCVTDTDEDGVCDEFEIGGCTDSDACNYEASATDQDDSCTYPASTYVDCDGSCLIDDDGDGVCNQQEVYGCTNSSACNFDSESTENDGSCEYTSCAGCTLETACNYDSLATLSNNITCTYIPAGWDDCDATICTDSDNDGNCDFDESAGCLGEFGAPHILLSGMLELATPVADWAANDYSTSTSDATGVEGITWMDYAGRLNDGRYSVTRIYTATDVCGNTSEAGQLLIADGSSIEGCTNASATNYNAAAVNDDGLCDYSPACLGDLNLDNIIGTSDLLILLSSFGLPCSE